MADAWAQFIERIETGEAKASYAAIFNRKGEVYAQSKNSTFTLSQADVQNLNRIMETEDTSICANGVTLSGLRFTGLRVENDLIVLQGKPENKEDSLVVCAAATIILIGFNRDSAVKTQHVRSGVEYMKEYLKSAGY